MNNSNNKKSIKKSKVMDNKVTNTLLSFTEASRAFQLQALALYELAIKNAIPHTIEDGKMLFDIHDLIEWNNNVRIVKGYNDNPFYNTQYLNKNNGAYYENS